MTPIGQSKRDAKSMHFRASYNFPKRFNRQDAKKTASSFLGVLASWRFNPLFADIKNE